MKAIATIAVLSVVAASAVAGGPANKKAAYDGKQFSITLGAGFPTSDTKDAGVSTMFIADLNYSLGALGDGSNAQSFVGLGGMWGNGDDDFKTATYGIHYGVMFGLGDANASMPLYAKLKGGYYSTRLTFPVVAGESSTKGGFGGAASLVWMPNQGGKSSFSIEGGYYFMPSVQGVNNTGYFFAIGIPFNSK